MLPQQDGLYSVLEKAPTGDAKLKLCATIQKTLAAYHNRLPLIQALADPRTRIASLTITEKGYCTDPAHCELLLEHPLIAHDLSHPEHPQSAIGILVAALALRYARSLPAFTIMSCDNCAHNGQRTRSAVVQFAQRLNPKLADWICNHVAFPSTMVDRIVPKQTERDRHELQHALTLEDHCGIVCEHFRQWIIEGPIYTRSTSLESC